MEQAVESFSIKDVIRTPRDEERVLTPAEMFGFYMNIESARPVMKGFHHWPGMRIGKSDAKRQPDQNEKFIGSLCGRQVFAILYC